MSKTIILIFLSTILFVSKSLSNSTFNIGVVDMNILLNESVEGKKIIEQITNENKKKDKEYKEIEKKLLEEKNQILSQKNLLEKSEYEKKVKDHGEKIVNHQKRKQDELTKLQSKKNDLTKKLLIKINSIIVEYADANDIITIINKDAVIITKNNSDITKNILTKLNSKN